MRNWYLIKTKTRQENIAIQNLKNQESFSSFEVAIFNPEGDFGTNEVLQIDDDVVGWQSREDINNIIEKIHTL